MKISRMIGIAREQYGIMFPLVMAARFLEYCVSRIVSVHRVFELRGTQYPYFIHLYNATFRSERTIEVPVARCFIKDTPPDRLLEIGNVLHHYGEVKHTVVDKYEMSDGVVNQDIMDFGGSYDKIISISTCEHIGFDEKGENDSKVKDAFEHIFTLLAPGGNALVTVPIGYNDYLDRMIFEGDGVLGEVFIMKRGGRFNLWKEVSKDAVKTSRYGVGSPCANAVAFCYIEKDV